MRTKKTSRDPETSIKNELLRNNILLSLIIMITLGGGLSFLFYQTQKNQVTQLIQSNNRAINILIDSTFHDAKSTIEFLSEQDIVRTYSAASQQETQNLLKFYNSISKANKQIKYLYSGYEANKKLIINAYEPPPGFDPTVRPWYTEAIGNSPNVAIGIAYQDAKTFEWLISTSKALHKDNGEIIGAVAYDMDMSFMKRLLKKQHDANNQSNTFVFTKEGSIIFHYDTSKIGQSFFDLASPINPLTFQKKNGYVSYTIGQKHMLGHYSKIDQNGWIVVTAINKDVSLWTFIWQATLCFVLILTASISWGFWQNQSMIKRIILPLIQLNKQIEALVSGNPIAQKDWHYPKNEIGKIAEHAALLAEKELLAKNKSLQDAIMALEIEKQNFKKMSNTDQLTLLHNRRSLEQKFRHEVSRHERYAHPFTILLIDIDKFKSVNDCFGHLTGDKVLANIAALLSTTIRETDILGRWGGEEFMVLCPNTDISGGENLALKICEQVRQTAFLPDTQITVSIGVSQISVGQDIDALIQATDDKLYAAKAKGRDRVIIE